jgi:uncharacterized Zn-binding protein involved in type VI secretion
MRYLTTGFVAASVIFSGVAFAQTAQPQPQGSGVGVITKGSGNVTAGGQPAARVGDTTTSGDAVVEGSPNVFINGKPAAVMGGKTGCGGTTVGGSSNVFVNGKPLARAGDLTTGCAERK